MKSCCRSGRPVLSEAPGDPASGAVPSTLCSVLLLAGLAVATYGNALHGAFHLDDEFRIVTNPGIQQVHPLWRHFLDPRTMSSVHFLVGFRPLLPLTLSLNHAISPGAAWSYHVFNIALLLGAAVLFFYGSTVLLEHVAELPPEDRRTVALVAAAVLVVHPISGFTVNYLSNRDVGLMSLFTIGTVLVFAHLRREVGSRAARGAGWGMALTCTALAMLSKQNGLVLPPLLWALDVMVFRSDPRGRGPWLRALPFVGIVLAYFAYTRFVLNIDDLAHVQSGETSPWVYFLTQLRAHVTEYAAALIWPFRVRALPDIEPVQTLSDPGALAGLALLIGTLGLAWRWRGKRRVVAFGIVAYWLLMATESSLLPLERKVAHYRVYPGSAYVFLAVAALAAEWLRGRALLRASLLPVSYLMVTSIWSNTLWLRPQTLWAHSIEQGAESIAYEYLAATLLDTDPWDSPGFALLLEARRRNPRSAGVAVKLGYVKLMRGEVEEGLRICHDVVARSPRFSPGWYGIAMAYLKLGRGEDAWSAAWHAVELEPRNLRYRAVAAQAAFLAGRNADGIREFEVAARLGALSPELARSCARALVAEARCAEALKLYERLTAARPSDRDLRGEHARVRERCAMEAITAPLPPPPPLRF